MTDRSQQGKGTEGSSNWSLSGYDYKRERTQLVRATVGDGQIIVRSDAGTGVDSTAGLNRDPSTSQIDLTNKERNTEFYVSGSSLSRVTAPTQTFAEWKAGLQNYGKSAVQSYFNYGVMAESALEQSEERPVLLPFALLAKGFVKGMNSLNYWTLGAVPGTDNSGGVLTQVPVLVSGDGRLYRVRAPFREGADGEVVSEEGKPVLDAAKFMLSTFTGFSSGDFLVVNGIMNMLEEAVVNGAMQSGRSEFVQFYNPTHGFIGDIIESAFDVLFGAILPSGISRQMREVQQQAVDGGVRLNNMGHSQGGLILVTALRGIESEKHSGLIQISGAPVLAASFHDIAIKAGYEDDSNRVYQVNSPNESFIFGLPRTDAVGDLLGLNFIYDDRPVLRLLGGIVSAGALLTEDSPHSNYACWVCGDGIDGQGRKIRESLPVPVFIDKNGVRR